MTEKPATGESSSVPASTGREAGVAGESGERSEEQPQLSKTFSNTHIIVSLIISDRKSTLGHRTMQ